jgi:hypothetical protein
MSGADLISEHWLEILVVVGIGALCIAVYFFMIVPGFAEINQTFGK